VGRRAVSSESFAIALPLKRLSSSVNRKAWQGSAQVTLDRLPAVDQYEKISGVQNAMSMRRSG
jgi:hypothetical protein